MTYSRDLTYSYEELQPFFINNAVGASIRRALGRRFDVLVSADRFEYVYEDLLIAAGRRRRSDCRRPATPGDHRVDTTWNYSRQRRLPRSARGASASASGTGTATRSRKTFRGFDNLRFGTTVTYGF